ncbi:MAG: SpoVA/SpoVAEb family sporulation membrane protein [Lachnospiraceae bacterium]|nr:SpoVA/SpoVAEb family sporulation membrane protein [Lachnospiraceae bacterium]
MELNKQAYDEYVKQITPTHPLGKNMVRAFLVGGAICLLGQCMTMGMMGLWGLEKEDAMTWTQLELILLSILLTGWNIYPRIVKWGGAGALVPITGFANSVVAPAIEYKAEGQVFGVGCKIFTIAGPVILFGVLASWVLGVIYWIGGVMGVI